MWRILAGLVSLAILLVGCTANSMSSIDWIPVRDDEVGQYIQNGYIVSCDNTEWQEPRRWNCYAIPKEVDGR